MRHAEKVGRRGEAGEQKVNEFYKKGYQGKKLCLDRMPYNRFSRVA
jgi:hypothetical protein